jgi:hypothetical protein
LRKKYGSHIREPAPVDHKMNARTHGRFNHLQAVTAYPTHRTHDTIRIGFMYAYLIQIQRFW